jgi:hypothetical protein
MGNTLRKMTAAVFLLFQFRAHSAAELNNQGPFRGEKHKFSGRIAPAKTAFCTKGQVSVRTTALPMRRSKPPLRLGGCHEHIESLLEDTGSRVHHRDFTVNGLHRHIGQGLPVSDS